MTSYDPATYQLVALKAGLKLYAKTGMKPNTAWTPTAMMRTAERLTGKTFKRRDYQAAISALQEKLDESSQHSKAD